MKQTLLLFTLFLAFFSAAAQNTDFSTFRSVVIPYNAEWEVTKPEAAVYKRVAFFPDSLGSLQNLKRPEFNFAVTDYYADGVMMTKGFYQDGKKWGDWTFYYPNGQLDCKGRFDGWSHVGVWEFWWPDGKPLMVVEFTTKVAKLQSFWNENGEQTVVDGNGMYTAITQDENGQQMLLKGAYKNGLQYGEWSYGPLGGEPMALQTFGEEGRMLQGVLLSNGKAKEKYTFGNRMAVSPEPRHLVKMESWHPDKKFYDQQYPVVADVFKCEVIKVEVDKNAKSTAKHYYKIMQRFESGTDTLEFGVPVMLPVFKRGMQNYIASNLKYPEHMKNKNPQGLIVVNFTVDAAGKVKNPTILKSLDADLDGAVLAMVAKMPDWQPGTSNGKPVDVLMSIPIRIKGRSFMSEMQENRQMFNDGRIYKPY